MLVYKSISVFRLAILFLGRDQGMLTDFFMLLLSLLPAMLVFVKRETVKTLSACSLHEQVIWQMCFHLSTQVNKTPQASVKWFCKFEGFFSIFILHLHHPFPDATLLPNSNIKRFQSVLSVHSKTSEL